MKVTVKHHLNVRVGKPSVNAPTFEFLDPGNIVEVDGKLYAGDRFEGIDTWLKDAAENYYWSGAFQENMSGLLLEVVRPAALKFDYNQLLQLPDQFKNTKGEGSVVAIVDTGCFNHAALGDAVLASFDVFTKKEDDQNDESDDGHGTFLAGIIAARENPSNEIVGVAPKAKLIVVKAVKNGVLDKNILAGLKWLSTFRVKPDVINLSVSFTLTDGLKQEFQDTLRTLSNQGIILVAAGQNESAVYSDSIFYPAKDALVLGVGSMSKTSIQDTPVHPQIDFVVPNINFLAPQNFGTGYHNLRGSSMSAAFVSGSLALIRAWQKANQNPDRADSILTTNAPALTQNTFDGSLKIFRK
ncbi:S8 family peptidase [Chryseolinea lacunae]|uniref:S8 family serine peptidase n=1 Tax=Chryseolinea lacunae TaxID=2801331 RepID=A0ABS1KRL2_9BACT|nr:S8 family serine peptidase [Chryseolinea lacunae]MBL0741980.1 S8 family serine peptidase [Chryseolinea lacunae]